MGSVKRDLSKSAVRHDVIYAYADAGIEQLLGDIYRIESEIERGDVDAACIRLDLERALSSRCLTPRQRQCVALYYFACLTLDECGAILRISHQAVDARLKTAIPAIAEYMAGFNVDASQLTTIEMRDQPPIYRWLTDVAMNECEWWRVPDDVWADMRSMFGDEPSYAFGTLAAASGDEYPHLTDGQMRHRNRNYEIMRPEIYPREDNVGSMRSGADGRKARLVRLK